MIKSNLTETMKADTALNANEEISDISLHEQNRKKRNELLQKQMELLSKASEETIDPEALTTLTKTMISICRYFYDDQIMHSKG